MMEYDDVFGSRLETRKARQWDTAPLPNRSHCDASTNWLAHCIANEIALQLSTLLKSKRTV